MSRRLLLLDLVIQLISMYTIYNTVNISSKFDKLQKLLFLCFNIGPRNCIGEGLSKSSLFLTLTLLVQQFSFGVDPEYGMPTDNNLNTITISPLPYNVLARIRN